MAMSYSKNPNLPKVRAEAVKMVRSGHSVREVARHFGYTHSAVVRWCAKVPEHTHQYRVVVTESSRPKHHPKELPDDLIQRILQLRADTKRGAEFIHYLLQRDGVNVSLSSVKRTLSRHGLTRYSNRWAYAEPAMRITAGNSARFVAAAIPAVPFQLRTVQTDHGSEFSTWFTKKLSEQNIHYRYSRIRKPNDNAHLKRFNRTIQEECILRLPRKLEVWQRELPEYLRYYNHERPHMGLHWQTPQARLQTTDKAATK